MLTRTLVRVNNAKMICKFPLKQETPIAIGAIGGSGTRVLAQIVEATGVFMGENINASHDNLEFTARFKNLEILTATNADFEVGLHDFVQLMRHGMTDRRALHWGWKEPNTHVVINRLLHYFPKMRYVHLLRSGLDMAFSKNKNQVRLWGPIFLKRRLEEPPSSADTLEYFCEVHRRMTAMAVSPEFQKRIIFIHFEELCRQPEKEITRLLDFLDLPPPVNGGISSLANLVSPPPSIGRWRKQGKDMFRPEDLDYLQNCLPETFEY